MQTLSLVFVSFAYLSTISFALRPICSVENLPQKQQQKPLVYKNTKNHKNNHDSKKTDKTSKKFN